MKKNNGKQKMLAFFIFSICLIPVLYIAVEVISTTNKLSAASVVSDVSEAIIKPEVKNSSASTVPTTPSTSTEGSTTEAITTSSSEVGNVTAQTYTVAKGQTLWEISQEQKISVQELMKKNQLSTGIIFEGQTLIY